MSQRKSLMGRVGTEWRPDGVVEHKSISTCAVRIGKVNWSLARQQAYCRHGRARVPHLLQRGRRRGPLWWLCSLLTLIVLWLLGMARQMNDKCAVFLACECGSCRGWKKRLSLARLKLDHFVSPLFSALASSMCYCY